MRQVACLICDQASGFPDKTLAIRQQSEQHAVMQVSLFGDGMGVISASLYVSYLSIGRTLRSWLPIFAYVFPLFSLATLTLCLAALIIEGAKFDTSTSGLFGQYVSWHYLWRTLYLGAVPGILGHVSFNALLKWLNPLIIALAGQALP